MNDGIKASLASLLSQLQCAYEASGPGPHVRVNRANGAVRIADRAQPIGVVFAVETDDGVEFFTVSAQDVIIGRGGPGDSVIEWAVDDAVAILEGIDDSDGDTYKISGAGGFGVADYLAITPAGLIGVHGATPVAQSAAYTPTNVTPDRSYDADSTTVDELADVLGTLIADLQAAGWLG